MKPLLTCAIGLAVLFVAAAAGDAQNRTNCAPRDSIIKQLAKGYGETRQSMGLAPNNQVIEVFASSETGTWTITVTSAKGETCLVATGEAYQPLAEGPSVPGDDA